MCYFVDLSISIFAAAYIAPLRSHNVDPGQDQTGIFNLRHIGGYPELE